MHACMHTPTLCPVEIAPMQTASLEVFQIGTGTPEWNLAPRDLPSPNSESLQDLESRTLDTNLLSLEQGSAASNSLCPRSQDPTLEARSPLGGQ